MKMPRQGSTRETGITKPEYISPLGGGKQVSEKDPESDIKIIQRQCFIQQIFIEPLICTSILIDPGDTVMSKAKSLPYGN